MSPFVGNDHNNTVITTMEIRLLDDGTYCVQSLQSENVLQACSIDIFVMSNRLTAILNGDFLTPSLRDMGEREGQGQAHSIARPQVPISSSMTHMVYLILFLSDLAGSKRLRPCALDTMTNTALEAITSSCSKNINRGIERLNL